MAMPATDRQPPRGGKWPDALCAAILLVASWLAFQAGFDPQAIDILPPLDPVVNFACGHGLQADSFRPEDPEFGNAALKRFIDRKDPSFSCADASQFFTPIESSALFNNHKNIHLTVGLWWKVFGVSWDNLRGYFFLLYATAILGCYALFRQVCGPLLAGLAALGLVLSPLPLTFLPDTRAYTKFPLFVLFLVCLARIAKSRDRSQSLRYCLAAGVIVGVGLGFRSDLILAALLFYLGTAVLWLTRPGEASKRFLPGALIFTATVCLLAWTILPTQFASSNAAHSFLLGLAPDKFAELGIRDLPCAVPTAYNDDSVKRLVAAYRVQIVGDADSDPAHADATYDRYCSSLFSAYMRLFPADVLSRALMAGKANLDLFLTRGALRAVPLPDWAGWAVPILMSLGLAGALWANWRSGLVLAACAGAFLPVTSLQWEQRHFFYLEFTGYFFLCLSLGWAGRTLAARQPNWLPLAARRLAGMAALAALAWGLVWAGLALARTAQDQAVARLFAAYVAAPTAEVPFRPAPGDGDDVALDLDFSGLPPNLPLRFLELRLTAPAGGDAPAPGYAVTARSPVPTLAITAAGPMPAGGTAFSVFLPYFADASGLVLNRAAAGGLTSIRVMTDLRGLAAICTATPDPAARPTVPAGREPTRGAAGTAP